MHLITLSSIYLFYLSCHAGSALEPAIASLRAAEAKLKCLVRERFAEAAASRDSASVERFFKLFALLGLQAEGLHMFAAFVRDESLLAAHTLLDAPLREIEDREQAETAETGKGEQGKVEKGDKGAQSGAKDGTSSTLSSVFFADLLNQV